MGPLVAAGRTTEAATSLDYCGGRACSHQSHCGRPVLVVVAAGRQGARQCDD